MIYGAFCCGRELPVGAHLGDEYCCLSCRRSWTMVLYAKDEADEDDRYGWEKENEN